MPSPTSIFYPTREAHYLTVDGDVLDRIAREYYGTERRTTEQVLRRNPWVAEKFPVMDAGLILVLPVLDKTAIQRVSTATSPPLNDKGQSMRKLWNYRPSKLWKGSGAATEAAATNSDTANALDAYRRTKALVGTSSGGTAVEGDCCVEIHNPPEFTDFEWLSIYYRDAVSGQWKLGRIHKSNVSFNTDGYGYSTAELASVTDPLENGLL